MAGGPATAADAPPLVLGIDPGLRVCGWGLVRGGPRAAYVAAGVIRPRTRDTIAKRLLCIYEAVLGVIDAHAPDEVAVEDPFVGALAPASALAIGQARAAAVLAAASRGLEVELYAPAAVKAAVSGYGAGDKRQVQTMVRLLLGLDAVPEPADAADALAVAMCHLQSRRSRDLVRLSSTGRRKTPALALRERGDRHPTARPSQAWGEGSISTDGGAP